jgi:hypothetical protein
MKGLKGIRFGLVGAAAVGVALVAGLLFWAQVSAAQHSLSMGSGEAAPGEEATVALTANVPAGLGAWTVDITYDPAVVTPTDCDGGDANSVCNTAYTADSVRVTGASAQGIDEEVVLSNITFLCGDAEDESALTLTLNVFADATIGAPQDISADAIVSNGSVTCAVPAPVASPTPALPGVGSGGGSDSGSGLGWIIAVLAGAGLAGIAGFGALRLRARS